MLTCEGLCMEAARAANTRLPCGPRCSWLLARSSRSSSDALRNFLALLMCVAMRWSAAANWGSGAGTAAHDTDVQWAWNQ